MVVDMSNAMGNATDGLDGRINQHFAGLVVRKDLVKAVKGNAIVPTYVLEYLPPVPI